VWQGGEYFIDWCASVRQVSNIDTYGNTGELFIGLGLFG
jgi:hypothetical protein